MQISLSYNFTFLFIWGCHSKGYYG